MDEILRQKLNAMPGKRAFVNLNKVNIEEANSIDHLIELATEMGAIEFKEDTNNSHVVKKETE